MHVFAHPLTQCLVCAVGFGIWPILRQYYGLPVGLAMSIMSVVQFFVVLGFSNFSPAPLVQGTVLFVLFGAIPSGVAIFCYGLLLDQGKGVVTTWLPVMAVMVPIVMVIGGVLLLGETMTMQKIIGVGVACYSIYLLSTSP
ncbi:MAG: hypothetical protein UW32_C0001G0272 [Candidatus Wolfebacteria bacterium GW2011_GWE2_44_13]|uniref:EamA domain-containing protein n=1 Tax=Candidatus Wolfebacteria bacterium GW2011_GWE2_44_13 TaxID=1619017 RepID=A0A0G1HAA2_9BACT|nr:MAG: hypothetical protein UW32_C0001G0272 [Candidatus Wolfebacteria bacterium GW2011_GWE2_44_13]